MSFRQSSSAPYLAGEEQIFQPTVVTNGEERTSRIGLCRRMEQKDESHPIGDGQALLLPTVAVGAKTVIDQDESIDKDHVAALEGRRTSRNNKECQTASLNDWNCTISKKVVHQEPEEVKLSCLEEVKPTSGQVEVHVMCCQDEVSKSERVVNQSSQEQVNQSSQEGCFREQVNQRQGEVNRNKSISTSAANSNSEGITSSNFKSSDAVNSSHKNNNNNNNNNNSSINNSIQDKEDKRNPHPNGDARLPSLLKAKHAVDPNCPTDIHSQDFCGDSCISSITPDLGEVYQGVMYPTLEVLLLDQHHHQHHHQFQETTFENTVVQQQQEERVKDIRANPANDNDQNNNAKIQSNAPLVTLSPSMVERVTALEQDVCAKRRPSPTISLSPETVQRITDLEHDVCAKLQGSTPDKARFYNEMPRQATTLTNLENNVLNKTTTQTTSGFASLHYHFEADGKGVSNPTITGIPQVSPGAYFIPGTNAAASDNLDHTSDTPPSDQLQHHGGNHDHSIDGTRSLGRENQEDDTTLTSDSRANFVADSSSRTRSVDSRSIQPSHFSASTDEVSSTAVETVTESHNNSIEALSGEEQLLTTLLAQASPVAPDEFPLQVAESVNNPGKTKHKGQFGWKNMSTSPSEPPKCLHLPLKAAALCLLSVLCAIIAAAVVLTQQQDSNELSQRDLDGMLIQKQFESVFGPKFFDSLASPQSRAWEWLVYRDPLQLNVTATNLLQRFLVVFFYISSTQQGPWKECNPPDSDLVTNNDNAAATTDLCYYEGLLGEGTYAADGYTTNYERFDEILAVRWLTGAHECHWAGLFCNEKYEIDSVHLDDMLLNGTLPSELSHLSSLRSISLSANELYGSIPSELASLKSLSFVALNDNALTGQIPSAWLDPRMSRFLGSLTHLDLSYNPLSVGDVLPGIPVFTNLENLFVDNIGITGVLPTELFQLTRLTFLYLRLNAITGTLPTEIGQLSDMQIISFHGTELSGTIPTEVGLMNELREIDMWKTRISGTIPEEIYTMETRSLNALILGECNLSGTISTNIGLATTLGYVLLSNNPLLTGTIPTEIGLLTALSRLDVDGTALMGSIPTELCALRGDLLLSKIKADCSVLSNGTTPMVCPVGCCTKCCNRETQTCTKTIYNDGGF